MVKIVNIVGGIGNQMFQYALAVALKHKFPDECTMIDISHFNCYRLHNGFELERVFGCSLPVAGKSDIGKISRYIPHYRLSRIARKLLQNRKSEYIEKIPYIYDPGVFQITRDCYFEGYWQTPKYFDFCRDAIIEAFSFPSLSDTDNIQLMRQIKTGHSISLHIRRGDYVNTPNYTGICTLEYYRRAIEYAIYQYSSPQFFVFSNDIAWCRENLGNMLSAYPVHYISHNKGEQSYIDMQLMSKAACCILANSSFSWWGAWLNNRPGRIVIAPKRWVNSTDSKDIYASDWVLV